MTDAVGYSFGSAGDPYFNWVGLLLHGNGEDGSTTVTDSSSSGKTVTANGGAHIEVDQFKWGGASIRTASAGDYLSVANSSDFNVSTGDFTIECWVRVDAASGQQVIAGYANGSATNSNYAFQLLLDGTTFKFRCFSGNTEYGNDVGGLTANTWYHVVMERYNNFLTTYIDGVGGTAVNVTGVTFNNPTSAVLHIGRVQGFYQLAGYIQDFRITNGAARYRANFTPSNTRLPETQGALAIPGIMGFAAGKAVADRYWDKVGALLHMDGSNNSTTFIDSSKYGKVFTASGNAKISTAQSKFGGSSALFDGTADYLTTPNHADFNFGTGDFTVECWLYINTLGEDCLLSTYVPTTTGWTLQVSAANKLVFNCTGDTADITGATTLTTGVWYHAAVARVGTSMKLFLNGVEDASVTDSQNITSTQQLYVGALPGFTSSTSFNGYIDEVRVTKDVGRYTANFRPPAAPFPDYTTELFAVSSDIVQGTGSAAGVGTATAVSAVSNVGSAAGTSTAAAVGAAVAEAAGSAAGAGTATAIGDSSGAATGSADGVAAVTAVGAATADAVGAAVGTSTVLGESVSNEGAGTAAGVGSASAVGTGITNGDGVAAGSTTVSGVGASTAEGAGTSSGVGSATGAATESSVGAASGASTVTAVGVASAVGVGSSAGTSTVAGVYASTIGRAGVAVGSAGVSGASIKATRLSFRLSGGETNADPKLSLGGPMSVYEIAGQTVTFTTAISGVLVLYAGGLSSGTHNLRYTPATKTIAMKASGDSFYGNEQPVGVTPGVFLLEGDNQGFLRVEVTPALLPGSQTIGAFSVVNSRGNLFDNVQASELEAGEAEYRCFYIYVEWTTEVSGASGGLYLAQQPTGTDILRIGTDPAGVGNGYGQGVAAAVLDENTAPEGVAFVNNSTAEVPLYFPSAMAAGSACAIWVKRIVSPNTVGNSAEDVSQLAVALP